jgi:serine/threonine-protein kinase
MAAIAPASCADLLDLIRKSNILTTERLNALPRPETLPADPPKAATLLYQKGFITRFQATQLLAGRHKGFRIGAYVIQDLLGRGGMGAVYLAEHLDLHRKVAIKVLAPGKGEDQRLALERFLREARAAAALDHPNIVRIHDVARHNDSPYLVMEFVEGETLQQTLERDLRVPFEMASEYVAQAAAGLQHAHEKGFVHRDIKPANLIRDRFGAVKILDMGLARSGSDRDKLTELLDDGAVVGTADFISPEQAINSPKVDGRADLYSLGATLFTLIAGRTPFEGNTAQKLMQHQMKSAPQLIDVAPTVPAELSAVVGRMMAKQPADRFPTAAEVIAALAPWTGSSTRVLAGLSRTNLGQSSDVQAALNAWSLSGSSLRLNDEGPEVPAKPDPSTFDLAEAAKATLAMSAAETTRSRTPAPRPAPITTPPPRLESLPGGKAGGLTPATHPGNTPGTRPNRVPALALEPAPEPDPNSSVFAAEPAPAPVRAPAHPPSNRALVFIAAGLASAVLAAGILIGWFAFGR